ncbi:MAG TPA: hypothetical protein DEQ14_08095, partial [Treponema sp.]|nr:hypothetical protein [Treponema sp.]
QRLEQGWSVRGADDKCDYAPKNVWKQPPFLWQQMCGVFAQRKLRSYPASPDSQTAPLFKFRLEMCGVFCYSAGIAIDERGLVRDNIIT